MEILSSPKENSFNNTFYNRTGSLISGNKHKVGDLFATNSPLNNSKAKQMYSFAKADRFH